MSFLHIYNFSRLKCLLVLSLIFSLAACSGGSGGPDGQSSEITTLNILGVEWTAPFEREDGAALSLSEIDSFHIYYGTEAGDYLNQIDIDDPSANSGQAEDIPSGTYHVVVTAIDMDGRESLYSSEIVITL